jgi:hypothetical protein
MRILITTSNRCPQGILWAPHFRDDGFCRCERRHDEQALTREPRSIDRETQAAARQARALSLRLDKR